MNTDDLKNELYNMYKKDVSATDNPINNIDSQKSQDIFAEKRRDDYMKRIARILIKGNATEGELVKHLDLVAKNCNPPFIGEELNYAIDSAIFSAKNSGKKWTEEVKEWVAATSGYFSVTNCYNELQAATSKDRSAIRTAFARLVKDGIIEHHGKRDGEYRKVDNELSVIDWQNAEIAPIPLYLPLGLDSKAVIEKKSIINISGVSNQGKSGFLLDVAKNNKHLMPTRYFASEWSASALKGRLSKFKEDLSVWEGITFVNRSEEFEDVIDPDGINIIDFLEVHDEAWRVSGIVKRIHEKLDDGIAIIAMQKAPGATFGKGGHGTMEKPQLYLTIDDGIMTVVKLKQPPDDIMNITGLSVNYRFGVGGKLLQDGFWGRLKVKKDPFTNKEIKTIEKVDWANE